MIRATEKLPQGYVLLRKIDMAENRKDRKAILCLYAALAAVGLLASGFLLFLTDFVSRPGAPFILLELLILIGLFLVPEFVHRALILCISGKRIPLKTSVLFSGSGMYFDKRTYLAVALIPPLVFQAALLLLQVLTPVAWSLNICAMQTLFMPVLSVPVYSACVLSRLPEDVLVCDLANKPAIYGRTPEKTEA